jgi:hypothetical protein
MSQKGSQIISIWLAKGLLGGTGTESVPIYVRK